MPAREIKTTLAIDGEKQFKQSMDEAYSSMKVLGSEMKLNTAQFKDNADSMEALTGKGEILSKQVDQQAEIVDALTKAVEDSAEAYGESDKRTDAYRVKLNNATATLKNMERELDQNSQKIEALGNETENASGSVDDLGDASKDAGEKVAALGKETESAQSKTSKFGDAMKKLGSTLKDSVAAAVKTAANATKEIASASVDAAKALFDMASETAQAGDRIDKMSQSLGLSTKGFQEWDFILSQNGASIDSMKSGMETLTNAMVSAIDGNEEAQATFKSLGVSLDDLKNKSREDIFAAVISGLQGISDETDKAATASSLFGGAATDMAALLNQTAESTEALRQKANELGMVMSDDAIAASTAFTDSMDVMQRTFSGIKNSIAAELLPGFTSVMDGLMGMVSGVDGASDQFKSGIKDLISNVTNLIKEWLPKLIVIGSEVLQSLTDGLLEAIPTLTAALPEVLNTIIDYLIDNLDKIILAAVDIIVALATGLVDAIPKLVAALPEIIASIVKGLLEGLPKIGEVGLNLVKGLWEGILGAGAWLMDKLKGWAGDVISGIAGFFGIKSPSTIMRDFIGKNLALGVADGIEKNARLVDDAMKSLMPDKQTVAMTMDISRRFTSAVTDTPSGRIAPGGTGIYDLSDSTIARIIRGFKEVIMSMPEGTVIMDDREMGRWVRKVVTE